VGVLKIGRNLDFLEEPLRADAERPFDPIAIGERGIQERELSGRVAHVIVGRGIRPAMLARAPAARCRLGDRLAITSGRANPLTQLSGLLPASRTGFAREWFWLWLPRRADSMTF
jgi:hypothetical protein